MFEFTELDGMSRTAMLLKQQECKREWKAVHSLLALWDAYGNNARALLDYYQPYGVAFDLFPDIQKMFHKGRKRQEKVHQYLEKVDGYLRELDTRLADGTKWHNAQDIVDMASREE